MKICLISHHNDVNCGSQISFLETLDALQSLNIECFVVIPSEGPIIEKFRQKNIAYSVIPYKEWVGMSSFNKRILKFLWNIFMVLPLMFKIKKARCNLVYTNTITICVG